MLLVLKYCGFCTSLKLMALLTLLIKVYYFLNKFFLILILQNLSHLDQQKPYLCMFGLIEYFMDVLSTQLKNMNHYVVCFDESLNKILQKDQMDIAIRYFSNDTDTVEARWLKFLFIDGRPTSENISKHFLLGIREINFNKIIQISMDCPSVTGNSIVSFFQSKKLVLIVAEYLLRYLACYIFSVFLLH